MPLNPKNIPQFNRSGSSKPIQFVDNLKEKKHMVLFYEDLESAKIIQFKFIKNGLSNGQCCCYFISHDENEKIIRNEMSDSGIDITEYEKQKLLHILHIPASENTDRGIKFCKKLFQESKMLKKPCLIIAKIISDIGTEISTEIKIEEFIHKNFEKFNVSLLCSINMESVKSKDFDWIKQMIQNHHSVIFSSSMDKGIAFDV